MAIYPTILIICRSLFIEKVYNRALIIGLSMMEYLSEDLESDTDNYRKFPL